MTNANHNRHSYNGIVIESHYDSLSDVGLLILTMSLSCPVTGMLSLAYEIELAWTTRDLQLSFKRISVKHDPYKNDAVAEKCAKN